MTIKSEYATMIVWNCFFDYLFLDLSAAALVAVALAALVAVALAALVAVALAGDLVPTFFILKL